MVFLNDSPWEDSEVSELKDEAEDIFNKLMEEYDEF